jgi:hypothetical protein
MVQVAMGRHQSGGAQLFDNLRPIIVPERVAMWLQMGPSVETPAKGMSPQGLMPWPPTFEVTPLRARLDWPVMSLCSPCIMHVGIGSG